MKHLRYNRENAVNYAHRWAFYRNPQYYNFDNVGGDCTNFVSQCILAGGGVMNYQRDMGWYYIDGSRKAPAWTGVPYLFNFLTRKRDSYGPVARECEAWEVRRGDVIQLRFSENVFQHTLIAVSDSISGYADEILVAAHTDDSDYRPIYTYNYEQIRFLHIEYILTGD